MTHIFNANKTYSINTSGSEIIFVEEPDVNGLARVQINVTEFCKAVNNVLPQPAINKKKTQKIQQLLSFGEGLSIDMQERSADFYQQQIQRVKAALGQLQAVWVELKLEKILKDTPYDASDVSDTSTISFCIRAFTAICDGEGKEYLRDQNFNSFKQLFFQHVQDLHKLVLGYEGKNSSEVDAFSDQEKAKYRALMAKLQECYRCLERLFVEKNELFEDKEKHLLTALLKFFVYGAPQIRVKCNVTVVVPHMKVTRLLLPMTKPLQDENPIVRRQKEYQEIVDGPKECMDITEGGTLCKLLKLFTDIVSKKVPFFDKPKNFQDTKKLFLKLVSELAGMVKLRFDEEIEYEEDITDGDKNRLEKLFECYQCLVHMYIQCVSMEDDAKKALGILEGVLYDNLPKSSLDSFKEFRERFKEDSKLKTELAAFYEMIFPDQLQEFAKMEKQQKKNRDLFFDQMVRKYIELESHPRWKLSINEHLDEYSRWKDRFEERYFVLKMEKLSL